MTKDNLKFTINSDGTIDCISTMSGNKYIITKNSCSCKGFIFRRNCRHFRTAKECGLIDKIKNLKISDSTFFSSSIIIKMRKNAIMDFLTKNKIDYTEEIINKIEPLVTIKTRPEKIIELAIGK